MSYGADTSGGMDQMAIYAAKIFKGAKPADMPIEQATKVDLFINHKTADAMHLAIPPVLRLQAEKVIE
jgi:putative ABC transport system substrate-binding protein